MPEMTDGENRDVRREEIRECREESVVVGWKAGVAWSVERLSVSTSLT